MWRGGVAHGVVHINEVGHKRLTIALICHNPWRLRPWTCTILFLFSFFSLCYVMLCRQPTLLTLWWQTCFNIHHDLSSFLANVNSTFTFAICRHPSVCRLSSVTFVHPTQATEIFGNVSTPFDTVAICWHPGKILRRSSQENPSVGGVTLAEYSDFGLIERYISETVQDRS